MEAGEIVMIFLRVLQINISKVILFMFEEIVIILQKKRLVEFL